MKKILVIIICIFLCFSIGKAQDSESKKIGIESISFFAGYYNPEMDFWNDAYLPSVGIEEKFRGNIILGGQLGLQIPYDLIVRAGMSYWKDNIKGNENSGLKKLEISFTNIKLGISYNPEKLIFSGFQPYAGIDFNYVFITNKTKSFIEESKQNGQTYLFSPLIGLNKSLSGVLIGVEISYDFGNYIQQINNNQSIEENKVSINGVEAILMIGYKF